MNKRKIGKKSEDLALNYLQQKGFTFIDRNYTISGGEIDLIMKNKDFIVFIEVKSLKPNTEFYIYETLTTKKIRFLKRAINSWLFKNNLVNSPWRVDFVGITGDKIEYFEFIDIDSN